MGKKKENKKREDLIAKAKRVMTKEDIVLTRDVKEEDKEMKEKEGFLKRLLGGKKIVRR